MRVFDKVGSEVSSGRRDVMVGGSNKTTFFLLFIFGIEKAIKIEGS